jgi:23S rRNA (guanine2445-N2)-methyltransferase / 23S rRNA (guanine2069-N7)-methyltransferase
MSAQRCNELRLTGSGGANRVMEAELKRLVMRSPFGVRLEKPKREGESTLLFPFDARVAWVAACHHRTSSRISWDLCSSTAVRLEPLFDDLLPVLSSDDRLPGGPHLRLSVEVGPSSDFEASPLQLRGVVKNAVVEALASRGVASDVDADSPDVVFVVRRAGTPDARRTAVGIDIGGGARHRRGARVAAGPAPLRETMAAQLIMLSRWDARSEPLVDPMAGGATIPIEAAGLAAGAAVRRPSDLPQRHLAAFKDLPREAPDLFPGTVPQIVALDVDPDRIPAMVGNLRAAGLTGPAYKDSIVIAQQDVRGLTPDRIARLLPTVRDMKPGVFCFNPPYGVRIGAEHGDEQLLALYSDMGHALGCFSGWRAACFVANPNFLEAFAHAPIMTKPASNADLRGAFFVFQL